MNKRIWRYLSCIPAALLAACGGGGGSGGPVASANAFNVLAGYQNLVASGQSTNLAVSGTCAGTASLVRGPANTAATFEGVSGFSATETTVVTLSSCTPASSTDTTTQYYDANYAPLGFSILGGDYGVWASPPPIPASVHVGDSGMLGTIDEFTDSSKSISTGREDVSYVIEADTATTAIVNLIFRDYDGSNVLQSTEQDRYRMSASGALTLISIDLQFADGTHLNFR